jgi:hypothetical protein
MRLSDETAQWGEILPNWQWNGTAWVEVVPTPSPEPTATPKPEMRYDPSIPNFEDEEFLPAGWRRGEGDNLTPSLKDNPYNEEPGSIAMRSIGDGIGWFVVGRVVEISDHKVVTLDLGSTYGSVRVQLRDGAFAQGRSYCRIIDAKPDGHMTTTVYQAQKIGLGDIKPGDQLDLGLSRIDRRLNQNNVNVVSPDQKVEILRQIIDNARRTQQTAIPMTPMSDGGYTASGWLLYR